MPVNAASVSKQHLGRQRCVKASYSMTCMSPRPLPHKWRHSRVPTPPLQELLPHDVPILSVSKGLEVGTGKMMSEIIPDVLGRKHPCAFLSGPSFAKEVMNLRPTGIVAASKVCAGSSNASYPMLLACSEADVHPSAYAFHIAWLLCVSMNRACSTACPPPPPPPPPRAAVHALSGSSAEPVFSKTHYSPMFASLTVLTPPLYLRCSKLSGPIEFGICHACWGPKPSWTHQCAVPCSLLCPWPCRCHHSAACCSAHSWHAR